MLNPRETAILIWVLILLAYAIGKKDVRSSLIAVYKTLLKLSIHPFFLIIYVYIAVMFCILFASRFLDWELIKDYLMWIIFGLLPMVFKVATKYKETTVGRMIKDVFKFSIIPSFIINEYTMSIWVELLLVPIIVLLTCIVVICDTDSKYSSVKKLTNTILSVIGLVIIYNAVSMFISNFSDVEKITFWEKMLFEIVGVLLHFPLLYLLQTFNLYDQIIIRTNLVTTKKEKILAAISIFKYCKMSREKLLSVLNDMNLNGLVDSPTRLEMILSNRQNRLWRD